MARWSPERNIAALADPVLVLRAAAGDDACFSELVRRHHETLRRTMFRMTGNAALADDLSQTACIKAWKNLAALRDARQFPAWLRKIALREWISHLRTTSARKTEQIGDEEFAAPDDAADARLDVQAALMRLGHWPRTCVVLAYVEGLNHAEIAALTGLPLGTVKSHILRTLPKLRLWLAEWDTRHES